jgi:hypothetical protein
MGHAIYRVEHFEVVAPYTLALRFNDGTEQRIDFRPVLEGEVFAPLRDLAVFNAVELDSTFGTVQWPTGADFDPETLHDWPKYRAELIALARRWSSPAGQHPNERAPNAPEPTARD